MKYDQFMASLTQNYPPAGATPAQRVLWHAYRGEWDRAHDIAQDMPGSDGSWLHAYLHRVEGDQANADYWYRRAQRTPAQTSIEEEWDALARHFTRMGS